MLLTAHCGADVLGRARSNHAHPAPAHLHGFRRHPAFGLHRTARAAVLARGLGRHAALRGLVVVLARAAVVAVGGGGAGDLVVVLALGAVRANGFPLLIVVLSGGAVRADAGAFDPVRPGGAARGGGDRATPFDTLEHRGLSGRTDDPSWTTEGGLIV